MDDNGRPIYHAKDLINNFISLREKHLLAKKELEDKENLTEKK